MGDSRGITKDLMAVCLHRDQAIEVGVRSQIDPTMEIDQRLGGLRARIGTEAQIIARRGTLAIVPPETVRGLRVEVQIGLTSAGIVASSILGGLAHAQSVLYVGTRIILRGNAGIGRSVCRVKEV